VSQRDVQLVVDAFGDVIDSNGTVDMKGAMSEDPPERFVQALDPGAEIRFFTAGGGTIGAMTGPFSGIEGFQAGWREWTEPFESFTATIESIEEGDDGRVLILVETRARLRGGGPEVTDHTAALYQVGDGRIIGIDHYLDQDDARRAAGLASARKEER
jgi:ketosteroid isomerase-like protein